MSVNTTVDGSLIAGRYRVLGQIGAGGMGRVMLANDERDDRRVALKTLQNPADMDGLLRLKAEFRTLSGLRHPNLVKVLGLVESHGAWYVVMEHVEGQQLGPALAERPQLDSGLPLADTEETPTEPGVGVGIERLQARVGDVASAFLQLLGGLKHLHEHGLVHRDVKPGNVLVQPSGRVVLVDFGLARVAAPLFVRTTGNIVGTPAYMSPEQLSGVHIGPESDLYSTGIMLYEALAGRLPFAGARFEQLSQRATTRPAAPNTLRPDLPEPLNTLIMCLLHPDPALRATGDHATRVLRLLLPLGGAAPQSTLPGPSALAPWQGRELELARMEALLEQGDRGDVRLIRVSGPSGIGKSRLVEETLLRYRRRAPELLILRGRCHPEASIPFKALDPIVDDLVRWLRRLPRRTVLPALPAGINALAETFPVLRRIAVIAERMEPTGAVRDRIERRRLAFGALGQLLGNLAARRPVVVWIDDLQWADDDSLDALAQMLMDSQRDRVVFVTTERPAAWAGDRGERLQPDEQRGTIRRVDLTPLESDDARELLAAVASPALMETPSADTLLTEARGSPFLLLELVRHAQTRAPSTASAAVADVVAARLATLSPTARELFEMLAVSGRPCATATLRRTMSEADEDSSSALDQLGQVGLVRRAAQTDQELVEPIHDRFREAALAGLSDPVRRLRHARLAEAMEADPRADSEGLADQWLAAGEPGRAAPHVEAAAERAGASFAFRSAESWARRRLEIGAALDEPDSVLDPWRARLAQALVGMGHAADAGEVFESLAGRRQGHDRLDLLSAAAEQFLFAGHLDRATVLYREALARIGLRLPRSAFGSLLKLLWARARVRIKALLGHSGAVQEPTPDQARRIDLTSAVAIGLSVIDLPGGTWVQSHHVRLAVKFGDRHRVARGLAAEAGYRSTAGEVARTQARLLLDEAWALLGDDEAPEVRGLLETMEATVAWSGAQWRACAGDAQSAVSTLARRCRDRTYQLNLARSLLYDAAIWLGEFGSLVDNAQILVDDARRRGDLYAETMFAMRFGCTAALTLDDVEGARRWLQHLDVWAQTGFHLQHLVALHHDVDISLYQGDVQAATQRLDATWRAARRALYFHSQPHRIKLRELKARVELAQAAAHEGSQRKRHLRRAARLSRAIAREQTRFAQVLSGLLNLCARCIQEGQLDPVRAAGLIEMSLRLDLGMHAHLLGAALGQKDAQLWLAGQRVARPDRWLRVYLPGVPAPASMRPLPVG